MGWHIYCRAESEKVGTGEQLGGEGHLMRMVVKELLQDRMEWLDLK